MDTGFEKLKQGVEAELGRPIEPGEEITMKGLYYFGKGLKLKSELESEPTHIKEILLGVMRNIARRTNRYREAHNLPKLREDIGENEHRAGVLDAVKDYHQGKYKTNRRTKRPLESRNEGYPLIRNQNPLGIR